MIAPLVAHGQDSSPARYAQGGFRKAADSARRRLTESVEELNRLRERAAEETVPLSRKLSDLEAELAQLRQDYQDAARELDNSTLDLSNLTTEIKSREKEEDYLLNLLSEFIRNFESRLHIAELRVYSEVVREGKLAPENSNLSQEEVFRKETDVLAAALDHLENALGGSRFDGVAVDPGGLVTSGTFVLIGPAAIFRSADGKVVGTAQQRLGSLQPAVIPFTNPEDIAATVELMGGTGGAFPLDPSLGNAHKIEETSDTFLEHVKKGGPVMIPIFCMAGAALLVALFKWLSLFFVRAPSRRRLQALLAAVARRDIEAARIEASGLDTVKVNWIQDGLLGGVMGAAAGATLFLIAPFDPTGALAPYVEPPMSVTLLVLLGGACGTLLMPLSRRVFGYSPTGAMLAVGVEHIEEPRELIEEVMYERVLAARLKLQRFLPFIAISAASAPLLGLLGTVTGIINTFKLITVFGSGDVKMLSGGISEALITTEYGLIVAIPSLLLHAFLSRKAKGAVDQMEKAAVSLLNQISKAPSKQEAREESEPEPPLALSKTSVSETEEFVRDYMDRRVVTIHREATIAEAARDIESSEIDRETEAVYLVEEDGKYVGHVMRKRLYSESEDDQSVESILAPYPLFVRVDTRRVDAQYLFSKHDLDSMPVLDENDILVGRVHRNGKEMEK